MLRVHVCVALLALPWLWPFTLGPTPNVVPLVASWATGLLALLVACHADEPRAVLEAAAPRAWLLAAVVSAAIGMLQWWGLAPDTFLVNAARIGEAYGNLRQRNQFATLTAIGLAVVVCRPASQRRSLDFAAVVVLAIANALAASRTGALQWVVITALAGLWPGPRKQRLVLCAVGLLAYGVAALLAPVLLLAWAGADATNVFVRMSGDLGCSSRKVLWSNVLHLIALKPWGGWGAGELSYAHYATLYQGPRFCDILDNAHNLPLHLAVEFGIPVAVAGCAAMLVFVLRGRPWREASPTRQLAWTVLAVVGLHSLLEYPLWYGPFQWATLAALALLLPPLRAHPATRGTASALVAAGMALLVYVAWEYTTVSQAYLPPSERRASLRENPVASMGPVLLFRNQVEFARLSITPLDPGTAEEVQAMALRMLHYSPEPAVLGKLIDSATLLGRPEIARWHAARFQAAFPEQYLRWVAARRDPEAAKP